MPSPTHADHTAAQPPDPGAVDALISQARQLRTRVDAVLRDSDTTGDPQLRWQRALCDLAVHQLDDLGTHLGQLRDGLDPADLPPDGLLLLDVPLQPSGPDAAAVGALGRAGSAQWDLLTDGALWSDELYRIFGRSPGDGPLTLDELPSWLFAEDQAVLTEMVTGCLVDGRPIDGEFRIVRADGSVRTVHMVGEPVLGTDGGTESMWAVLRDVSDLRRSQRTLRETRESLQRQRQIAQTERRMAVELQEAVLPPWRGAQRFPLDGGPTTMDLAAHYLPSATSALIGGDWYDAMQLPDGASLLTVGDLTGHGVTATSGMAMLLGALRGMAVAGLQPGPLMGWLNELLDTSPQPALGSALCCRYEPDTRELHWAQAGHPAPLLFRNGTGRSLDPPDGVLLGATSGAQYGQAREQLAPGDLLVLHTDGLAPRRSVVDAPDTGGGGNRLLAMAPLFSAARSAQDCVRLVAEEFGTPDREDDACVLIARIL
ncbi:SpoIIE family protein phosphatase [Streptomyces cocklensis]|jgi:PAS domain S-box-containing protein|uniref:PAS domain S-box-containing protein n=1 Tax=Actinacidiphila cocklensis TaxID=887465 RepID=A0A9W4DRB1_9ACTN|nr:SpoIIE family protein phosphatase [Actinacidiphila cocklensis]MDD1063855.1 SpoIIE family protein phosphatase [Actinacidiphila cocklensis]WSX73130.1 SpoIIE family protein phosphatase [Streptomyces sp. NBC_00899]WSX80804.1 SpoIIE family protein phosphatase [Streptomyces sp. NBC_00899]CAG6392588.1 PAS domain S-box-containing protein [Actinacidiphila cocklensis]